MERSLQELVWQRAGNRCEYCQVPQSRDRLPFEIDHIIETFSRMDHRLRTGRRRSFHEPGHAHELTFTCDRRFRFLASERTCHWLAEAIAIARTESDFALWVLVFMPEHMHLIVWPKRRVYEVSDILSAIKEHVGRKAVKYLKVPAPD
jgi:hypothetical protein